jgi:short-subunit dehydrogenase
MGTGVDDLKGRTAIVTGASRGIGAQLARALCKEDMNVVLVARAAAALEQLASDLGSSGQRAIAVPADLNDPESLDRIVETTTNAFGQVDLLVNNAGINAMSRFTSQSDADVSRMIDVNFTSGVLLTRRVLPGMIERGSGHVVMMASLAGKVGAPYESVYAATKAAQIAFVQSLRAELRGTGVGASAVCPGFVKELGMWEDAAGPAGVKPPRLAGSSSPDAVVSATLQAIARNQAAVYVNRPPLRPMVALGELSPRFGSWIMRRIGVDRALERVLEHYEKSQTS